MKNLLVYTNPDKQFREQCRYNYNQMAKIQIDNSLDLGWRKEDILLVTNFDYEYNGVKSLVVDDKFYCDFDITSSKIPVIDFLLNKGNLEDELYWYHDMDAYQDYPIEESELGLDGFDLGLTTYGYKEEWNCGSFFFRKSSKDIFELINSEIFRKRIATRCDEKVLVRLIKTRYIDSDRYKVLNNTYNFNYKFTYRTYRSAIKPLRVLHFNPDEVPRTTGNKPCGYTNLDSFMYGKYNIIQKPFMSERLIRIFHEHNIK